MGIFEEETRGMGWLLQEQALGSPHPSPLAEFGLSSPTLKAWVQPWLLWPTPLSLLLKGYLLWGYLFLQTLGE